MVWSDYIKKNVLFFLLIPPKRDEMTNLEKWFLVFVTI